MVITLIYSLSLRSEPDGSLLLIGPRAKKATKTVVRLVKRHS